MKMNEYGKKKWGRNYLTRVEIRERRRIERKEIYNKEKKSHKNVPGRVRPL